MRILWGILLGGLIAGGLDITYACVAYGPLSYGISPEGILQSVAAGWVGREASRAGGVETALLGLGSHFLIAMIMAGVYVLATQAVRVLAKRTLLFGVLYGFVLYIAMNYIVVPLSAAATGEFAASLAEVSSRLQVAFSEIRGGDPDYPWMLWGTIFAHTGLVGIPIAWAAKRFTSQSD